MLMDLHVHTSGFSPDSRMTLEACLERARLIGLDGVCLTEHDVIAGYEDVGSLAARFGLVVLVGVEILTLDGDILCFGLDRVPDGAIGARELTAALAARGGATVAAHPYRDNKRGVEDLLFELPDLTAVEGYNGNTSPDDNLRAARAARELGLPVTGSSDAHGVERVGAYATMFDGRVASVGDLAAALRGGDYRPVRRSGDSFVDA